jgi:hypothetical protein
MRYERLSNEPQPADEDIAFLYQDDGNPVRDHFVCYRISPFEQPRRYVVAHMASEDTDFYNYRGAPPEDRGLEIFAIYRLHGSDKTNGYDQFHIILCFADKSIEFTGLSFGISEPMEGPSAASVLLDYLRRINWRQPTG